MTNDERGPVVLNGSDYLMLGFDHDLRRQGFAGNSCQIILELRSPITPAALQQRLDTLHQRFPILHARPGGLVRPRWKSPRRCPPKPQLHVHSDRPNLYPLLFNTPLATNRGELVRFDLVERSGDGSSLIFTWAHPLMDAAGAEYLLALAARDDLPCPPPQPAPPSGPRPGWLARCKMGWNNLHQLDQFCRAAPRSLGQRHPAAPSAILFRVEKFSAEETARARANAVQYCGVLGDAQFHAAVAVLELHHLHERLGCASPSYVVPLPVGLRPKGALEPIFGNQVAMLMLQFLPEHLDSLSNAVACLKSQTADSMRAGLLDSGRMLSDLFRFLPLPIYAATLKRGLRGEICSLFYGDTAAVNPLLTSVLGAPIHDFIHLAAVTPSPGLGVIFYYFRNELRLTVLHSAKVLTEAEAAQFAADLRKRLLGP